MGKPRSPWGKGTTIAIFCFLLALLWAISKEASAETQFEISGYAVAVGGERYESETIYFTEEFNDKYQVGLLLQLRLDCVEGSPCKRGESSGSNQAFYFQRVVKYQSFRIGIGASYWKNQSPAWNSHTPYMLTLGYQFTDNLSLSYRHFSTGGSSSSNGGLDTLGISWNF